jgi:hypothetical protein
VSSESFFVLVTFIIGFQVYSTFETDDEAEKSSLVLDMQESSADVDELASALSC